MLHLGLVLCDSCGSSEKMLGNKATGLYDGQVW